MPKPRRSLKPKPTPSPPTRSDEDLTRSLLHALNDLDRAGKFRLAAIVMWMRGEWRGDSEVLGDIEKALKLIAAMTQREKRQAVAIAAETNLRAAVTS